MAKIPDVVYVIYSADAVDATSRLIGQMSPAEHMTAGYSGERLEANRAVAAKFDQTEGDDQYEFSYLADESGRRRLRYLPLADRPDPDDDPDGYDSYEGQGQHRKWVALLTIDEWRAFADAYLIDLVPGEGEFPDETAWMPERYEETMGAITEYGCLEAISVDNTEGWQDGRSDSFVIDSSFYVSFGYDEDPGEPGYERRTSLFAGDPDDTTDADVARMETDGAGLYAPAAS